jgi:hypothetical protein
VLACALAALLSNLAASPVDPELAVAVAGRVAIGYSGDVAAGACTPSGVPL